jgi:hypothetical protein
MAVLVVVVVAAGAAALVAEMAMQRPRSALVREQRVDDLVDRGERRELVGELAVELALDHLDVDRMPVESQLDPTPGHRDLDVDAGAAVSAGYLLRRGSLLRLLVTVCHDAFLSSGGRPAAGGRVYIAGRRVRKLLAVVKDEKTHEAVE